MPIRISDLENASYRYSSTVNFSGTLEAKAAKQSTAFLSHSHKDAQLAKGLQVLLKEKGWDVYIDWEDTTMPDTPTRETAEKIQKKIRDSDWFLFLATPNSTSSRWCPWEIGYADGKKPLDSILIIPTTDRQGNYYGNEYKQTKNLGPDPFDYLGVRYNIEGTKLTMIEFNGTNWVEYDEIDGSSSYSVNAAQERRGKVFKLSHFYRTYLWNKDDGYNNFSNWVSNT